MQVPASSLPSVLSSSKVAASHSVGLNPNPSSHTRSVYFSDLPYMGEITLDNSKPRRGRKPKKADICHLIYKNYGTILSKRPDSQECIDMDNADLKLRMHKGTDMGTSEDQPLNLCLRDQPNDSYSISSADDASETNSSCPTPVTTPSDFQRDSMLANNLKSSLSNMNEVDGEKIKTETQSQTQICVALTPHKEGIHDDAALNPLTAYYQKLLESGVLLNNPNGVIKTIQKDNQLALKIPLPSGMFLPTKFEKSHNTLSPALSSCNNLNMEYPEQMSTPSSIKSENSTTTNVSSNTALGGTTSSSGLPLVVPQKRKRSAIFIPPMNTENTTNPATEVSICKFKFTGGSKPTLQEKKMLSVDAGGNYRYFSGTGDKTSRGYEYFPRESLQQTSGLLPGVNCIAQKISVDNGPPSAALSNELLYISESPTTSVATRNPNAACATNVDAVVQISHGTPPPSSPTLDCKSKTACHNHYGENKTFLQATTAGTASCVNALNNRYMVARKKQALHQLRKSTQREKLEKTFKEQGFLIQTQQLESAEGATYCKFRQLKKFTRYLFRNWKDYLPEDLQRNPSAAALAAAAAAADDFANREQESKSSTAATIAAAKIVGVNDLAINASCLVENVMTCGEENFLQ